MPSDRLKRAGQAVYLRDVVNAADTRTEMHHRLPALDSPARCTVNLRTGHHAWHRGRDGLRRCVYCCAVQLADGRIARLTDPNYPRGA